MVCCTIWILHGIFFFFKQKTAYEMRISDWSSDVCSSDLGSKPGERRGGRTKGVPNKATASIRDIARQYTEEAVNGLVAVLRDLNEPAAARVSAAHSILDRGYGKHSPV